MDHALHASAGRQEAGRGILGVHARLDAVPVQHDVVLPEAERSTGGDEQLLLHEVEPGDLLGHGVLDLQPRVHLHEEELLRPGRLDDELHGAGAAVVDAARGLAGGGTDRGAGGRALRPGKILEQGGGRLLDHLLVPALQRALAFAEVHDVSVRIGEDLHLDVPGGGEVALQEQRIVAEARRGLAPGGRERVGEMNRVLDHVHALAAATRRGLDEQGIADLRCRGDEVGVGEAGAGDPRHGRHGAFGDGEFGGDLVAHGPDRVGARPDEHDPRVGARLREGGVLGEEPVARVDRLCACRPGRVQHGVDAQVALRCGGGTEADGDVGERDMTGTGVGVAVDGDGADPEPAQRGDDAAGDLAAVGDEDGVEHRVLWHLTHIRKTP